MKLRNSKGYQRIKKRIESLVENQNRWRSECINLIASENVVSHHVANAYINDFMHRYAEGEPYDRYYNGTRYIDELEELVSNLMAKLVGTRFIDIRPISGTTANIAVFSSLTKPGDTIVSLSTPMGGHISHNKYGAPSMLGLNVMSYVFDKSTMNIDVKETKRMLERAGVVPRIFVLGASLFLFPHPIKEVRELANEYNSPVVYDAAHVFGLVVGKQFQDPIKEGADIITASTHKTFPGPQGGVIATNNEQMFKKAKRGTFPRTTSNHHLHRIPALGISALEMQEFGKKYARDTVRNAKALAESMHELGLPVIGEELGFTKSHQIALDMSRLGLDGQSAADLAEQANIIVNKNLLPWEPLKNAKKPSGIRIGVQEMTRYGMGKSEMWDIAVLLTKLWMKGISPQEVKSDVLELRKEFNEIKYTWE